MLARWLTGLLLSVPLTPLSRSYSVPKWLEVRVFPSPGQSLEDRPVCVTPLLAKAHLVLHIQQAGWRERSHMLIARYHTRPPVLETGLKQEPQSLLGGENQGQPELVQGRGVWSSAP